MHNPTSYTWFTDPTKQEACDSYTKLYSGEISIEMSKDWFGMKCPFFALFYLEFELWKSYLYERKFTGNEKRVECNENESNNESYYYSETGVRVHI